MPLFEVTPTDRRVYTEELEPFLPRKIIDIHTHVWRKSDKAPAAAEQRSASWPRLVAEDNPIEDLLETYRLMFPGKQVTPLIFSSIKREDPAEEMNAYISRAAKEYAVPALIYADPVWSPRELEEKILRGGFLGAKVYLDLAPSYIPSEEIRIYDFLPPRQLDVLNRLGLIVMLHIPRPGRLRDPVNLAQMLEIEASYPNISLIIAHVGRAYCREDLGDAMQRLSSTRRMLFDISANTNSEVFEALLHTVGPERVLFGSDLPILRMRMRRICRNGSYVNIVPPGLYGDVSGDNHMQESSPEESEELTFFMYEELRAFRRAAEKCKLNRDDLSRVFYHNAREILEKAQQALPGKIGAGT